MVQSSFYKTFLRRQSKTEIRETVDFILANPDSVEELMECFFHDEMMICQRASWPVTILAEQAPELLKPYIERIVDKLKDPKHDAVVRNAFRSFQFMDISEEHEGIVFESAFEYLLDVNNAVAIRVFAMTVCANIALKYPELKNELIPVIQENIPHGSAGFRARGKKLLNMLAEK